MSAPQTPDAIELPYIPLWVGEWIANYSHLGLAEQGALMRLVIYQWRFESVPGADVEAMANILGVGRPVAAKLLKSLAPLFNMRTLEGEWQIGYFVALRAKAAKKAKTDAKRAKNAASARWRKPEAAILAPSEPSSTPRSNAPSIENDAPSIAPSYPSQRSKIKDQDQGGVVEASQAASPAPPPPQRALVSHGGPLVGRGETVGYDRQMTAKHAACHSEVCLWKGTARRCMPAALVLELAANYADGTQAERIDRLIAWALAYVPPAGSVASSSDFVFWRVAFDSSQATPISVAEASSASTVPSEEETIRRYGA